MQIILQNTPYIPKRRKEAIINVKKREVLLRKQKRVCRQCCCLPKSTEYKA